MPVFTDSHAHNIRRELFKQFPVPGAFFVKACGFAVDVRYAFKIKFVENLLFQEDCEALRVRGGQSRIFVHMEGVDF
jgi:hypothetical protein